MKAENCWSETLALETADCFLRQQEPAAAMDVFQMGQRCSRHPAVFDGLIEQLKVQRPKVAFFCGADGDTFFETHFGLSSAAIPRSRLQRLPTDEMKELMNGAIFPGLNGRRSGTNRFSSAEDLPDNCPSCIDMRPIYPGPGKFTGPMWMCWLRWAILM